MRTIIVLIYALLLTGCGGDGGAPTVVASFYPLAFAAEAVAGPGLEVRNLTPPGSEPHELDVSPGDVHVLQDAELVLLVGEGFQPALEDAAGDGGDVLRILELPGLGVLPDGDPHVWLDPIRFAVIVESLGAELDAHARANSLVARLRRLDRELREGLARCERRQLVTSHAAFAYLADRYGLEQIALTGLTPEAEPSPRELERTVDRVRETGATTVFFEPLVSPRLAETVARETGAQARELNPIEGLTQAQADGGEDYFSLMRANLQALRSALECS